MLLLSVKARDYTLNKMTRKKVTIRKQYVIPDVTLNRLKENLQHYLSHKVGAKWATRNKLTSLVFSLRKVKMKVLEK